MKDEFSIDLMCKLLLLPRRTYYDISNWKKPSRQLKTESLDEQILAVVDSTDEKIGSSQVLRLLQERGVETTQQTVWRRMKKLGLLEQK